MEWIQIAINGCTFLGLVLFIKNFFPSYMEEKGKNLATKEDIQEITRKTEEVQNEFREGFELFSSDVRFKYDFYYKQYTELYCKLYAMIIQSEYIRYYVFIAKGDRYSFETVPFFEMSPINKITQEIESRAGNKVNIKRHVEEIETPVSMFNKEKLYEYIIDNGHYATPKLLKIAIAYRFAYTYYSGNKKNNVDFSEDTANKEEFKIIQDMVKCIVMEYNFLRKELKMSYNETELETGTLQLIEGEND